MRENPHIAAAADANRAGQNRLERYERIRKFALMENFDRKHAA